MSRFGLSVHLTAPTIHAGFRGRIQLELVNDGKIRIRLREDMRICQLIFELTLELRRAVTPANMSVSSPAEASQPNSRGTLFSNPTKPLIRQPQYIGHAVQARGPALQPPRRCQCPPGEDFPATGLVGQLNALVIGGENH